MARKLFALVAATLLVFGVFGPSAVAGASAAGNDAGNDETDDRGGNATDAFGLTVSAFVHGLLEDDNESNVSVGYRVATFVVANNPGNAPDHAGPPENVTQGPPETATQGQPEDAGPDGNETGPPQEPGPNGGQGPPEGAGPGTDEDETDDEAGNASGNGKAKGRDG